MFSKSAKGTPRTPNIEGTLDCTKARAGSVLRVLCKGVAALFSLTLALNASVTYTDSAPVPANYSIQQHAVGASIAYSGANTFTGTFNLGSFSYAGFAAMRSSFLYDPSTMGTLNSIDASAMILTDLAGPWILFLYQEDIASFPHLYRARIGNISVSPNFQLGAATGLTAASFAEVNLTTNSLNLNSQPNFAAPFILGFGRRTELNAAGSSTTFITFDDISITLNTTPNVEPVPEPAAFTLLASSLAAIALRRRL